MSTEIVKVFMLICFVSLIAGGYLYISQEMGFAPKIIGNLTDNKTLVAENSTFYESGNNLIIGMDLMPALILVFVLIMVIVAFIILWSKYR